MTVSEFRQNLKKYLDQAAQGQIIVIERGGLEFVLRTKPTTVKLPPGVHMEHTPAGPNPIAPLAVNPKSHTYDQSQLKKRSKPNGPIGKKTSP